MSGRSLGRRAFIAGSLLAATARGKGRTPAGGRVALHVPWPVGALDPHRLDDPMAAIFGEAVFDTLYAADGTPALADGEPEQEAATIKVKVRIGVRTAKDRPYGTKDAVFALERARASGARGWLADIPKPREDGRTLYFTHKDPVRLKAALASPLVAMVPLGFDPLSPDGTGPFRVASLSGALTLERNKLAARGPAFLDEVVVTPASSVSASLLAFEAGSDDVGWFERGLHEPRSGSKSFDYGAAGWATIFTGRDANDWDAPGIAQSIADGIPYSQLASLHLGAAWPPEATRGWGGPPVTLIVRDDAPWMIEVANAIASSITRPSHEVTVKPVPASELAARRASRIYGLALDVVRNPGGGTLGAAVALTTANDASRAGDLVLHPPKLGDVPARTLTRTLRVGIIGEVKVAGGRIPELVLAPSAIGHGFDLGASYRARH